MAIVARMRLGTKLVASFLACGLIPLGVIAMISFHTADKGMSALQDKSSADLEQKAYNQLIALRDVKRQQIEQYFAERKGDMAVLVETVNTLRSEAFQKLTAVREIKRGAIERYFQTIEDQILTFSEDQMIVDATRAFREAFGKVRSENEFSDANVERMRSELKTYYTDQFAAKYREENDGGAPDIQRYFDALDEESVVLQHQYIQANENPLGDKHKLDRAPDKSTYSEVHGKVHPIVRSFLEQFGYYDIFIADPQTGDIVYSVFKELDYSTSLIDGPYAQTNFGEAFRKANAAGDRNTVILVDYKRYAPSYEAPASFIASPIFDGDEKIGVALFQMPIDRLNQIMSERAGLGKTGETYLVGQDLLMRSDSYLDPENHTVAASFKHTDKGKVDTTAARAALAGQTATEVIVDYEGNPVLSAYCPVDVGGITWALLAEIDVAEAFAPHAAGNEKDFFTLYNEQYGYYDLFLVNPDGYCFYTVCHEADYQTNLVNGKYKDTNLGLLVREVLGSKQFGFVDFAPYAPSNGTPAAFIAQPVLRDGSVDAIVALQLPLDAINRIMGVRIGMGETGETYLVGQDKLMRSDSFLDPVNHTVKASFASPSKGSVDTEAAVAAIKGDTGFKCIIDYNGNPVLSAYAPVSVFGTTWALLAEIDEAEAMAAVKSMKETASSAKASLVAWIAGVAGVAAVLVGLVSLVLTRSITRPLKNVFRGLKTFSVAELRQTGETFKRIIDGLTESSAQVNDAAGQVSNASQQLAQGASEQASSIEETSSALEEMAAMTRNNAANAKQADGLAGQTHKAASEGERTMATISESSDQISKIIKVIEEIAFQTNLLALNAAVEAARAGEHGKGFAVVADEVRSLAQRAAQAAKETTGLIEGSVNNARAGSEAIEAIVGSVTKVTELIKGIAQASEEQAEGVEQVNTAVSQMAKVTQENASGAEECASASEELSAQAEAARAMVAELLALTFGDQGGRSGAGTSAVSGPTGGKHVPAKSPQLHRSSQRPVPAQRGTADTANEEWRLSSDFMSLEDEADPKGF